MKEAATEKPRPVSAQSRTERMMFGKGLVAEQLENAGCVVELPAGRADGKLEATTPSGRSVEIFVSTQGVGGYAFWTKRRLRPADDRLAAIVLVDGTDAAKLYLVPSTEWRRAEPPLKDRDNVGKRSEPEYGISLARSSLPALQRYRWDGRATDYHR